MPQNEAWSWGSQVESSSQFLTQGAFDQVELDFRSGRGSQECNHLAPRFEDAVEPANEGHHNPDFGFSVEYHDPEANSSTKTAVDCRALIKNFSPNFSLKTASRARQIVWNALVISLPGEPADDPWPSAGSTIKSPARTNVCDRSLTLTLMRRWIIGTTKSCGTAMNKTT